jgi:Cd(II)/Pb(II)-responsive transcriptional regulator
MRIGELAKRAVCTVETIRFYERAGLLPRPARSGGNYRLFSAEDAERLAFIRNCRSLGMALAEIRVLLGCRGTPDTDCREVNALLDLHILRLEQQINSLKDLDRQLHEIRQLCNDRHNPEHRAGACGIIRILGEAVDPGHPESKEACSTPATPH